MDGRSYNNYNIASANTLKIKLQLHRFLHT